MAARTGWSLREIDETCIESLLSFLARAGKRQGGSSPAAGSRPVVACDQAGFLNFD